MFLKVLVVLIALHLTHAQETIIDILQNLALPLTPKCQEHFEEFLADFAIDENSWALQMVDATSKIPSGILNYNFGEMGDFQQCINIRASGTTTETILGKYCLGYVFFNKNISNTSSVDGGSVTTSSVVPQVPTWALCLPSGCTTDDANLIGNAVLATLLQQDGIGVTFSDFLCQTVDDVNPKLTNAAIVTIIVLVFLVAIVLGSTFYDVYCTACANKHCPMVLKAFSIYTNGQKIFKITKVTSDHLPCLDGLKVISMMWIVAGHQFSIPIYGTIANTKHVIDWMDKLYSMWLISATLAVDTFFIISGFLLSYGFMKAKYQSTTFNILLFYLHRYLRLTAPLVPVVLISATLLKYLGAGPKWPYMSLYFQKNCEDYWWSTLLYSQNYINISNMCVGQTWYLNVDMQLYIISPLILICLWKYPKFCFSFLGTCSLLSLTFSFYTTWRNELPAILSNLHTTHSVDYQNKYYLLTHTRFTPWVIGVVLGYSIYKRKHNETGLLMSRSVVLSTWVVCCGTLLACVFGGHGTLRGPQYDKWGNALHVALVRPCWSLAIAWIILACASNNGGTINRILSLPIFQVLNRFTYGIYLTHVTLLYGIAYGRKTPIYFSEFDMVYQFGGTVFLSSGLAVVLALTTEAPVLALEKILRGRKEELLVLGEDVEQISLIEERIKNQKH